MRLIDQKLWIIEASQVFAHNHACDPRGSALELARALDAAGLTEVWEDAPYEAALRQIREWDDWARDG